MTPPPLTSLGLVHVLLSLLAIGLAIRSMMRRGCIQFSDGAGRAYAAATLLTALTALGLHQRATFGPGHVLAVLTLVALVVAAITARGLSERGSLASRLHVGAMTATLLFHAIPGVTEALTRLPPSAPLLDSPDSPVVKGLSVVLLVVFGVLIVRQARADRRGDGT